MNSSSWIFVCLFHINGVHFDLIQNVLRKKLEQAFQLKDKQHLLSAVRVTSLIPVTSLDKWTWGVPNWYQIHTSWNKIFWYKLEFDVNSISMLNWFWHNYPNVLYHIYIGTWILETQAAYFKWFSVEVGV